MRLQTRFVEGVLITYNKSFYEIRKQSKWKSQEEYKTMMVLNGRKLGF